MSEEIQVERLSVSSSPHIRDGETTSRIMWTVNATLAPVALASLYIFGWYAGVVILTSVASCVFFEALWQKLRRMPVTVGDGSAVITGLLLAFVLPPNVPLFVAVVGSCVAILIAKQLFGGLGYNIWNPALVGRAFVQIAYPTYVTLSQWPLLKGTGLARVLQDVRKAASSTANPAGFDAVTQATPLSAKALASFAPDAGANVHVMYGQLKDLALGTVPGCVGETSAVLIILGGAFLIYKGYVNWKVPVVFAGTVFLFAFLVPSWKVPGATGFGGVPEYAIGLNAPTRWFLPFYEILAGGLMLGAFYMATDMVTSPMTSRGQVIFALGCGLITSVIRMVGHGFPEGVCYSILLMNTAVPVIDRYTRPTKYGAVKT